MAKTTSYYVYQRYEKRGDQGWIPSYPNVYSKDGDGTVPLYVRQQKDYECGFTCEPEFQWVEVPITEDYECDECGDLGQIAFEWRKGDGYECVGTEKHEKLELWTDVGNGFKNTNSFTKPGDIIEEKSTDCGYVYPRLTATLMDGKVLDLYTSFGTGAWGDLEMSQCGIPPSQVKELKLYRGGITCGNGFTFDGLKNLTSITADVANAGESPVDWAFASTGLKTFRGKLQNQRGGGESNNGAFYGCRDLTSFTVTNSSLEKGLVGNYVFAECSSLPEIDLGCSMISPGTGFFMGCDKLREAKISTKVFSNAMFERNTALTSVKNYVGYITDGNAPFTYLAPSLNGGYVVIFINIGDRAFFGCKSLTGITNLMFDSQVIHWDESSSPYQALYYGFSRAYSGDGYEIPQVIPTTPTEGIGRFAFYGCESLTSEGIEGILVSDNSDNGVCPFADGVFAGCKSLVRVPMPSYKRLLTEITGTYQPVYPKFIEITGCTVGNVGAYAFSGCSGINQAVLFSDACTSIGDHAFDGCTSLPSITFTGDTPPAVGVGAFDNTGNCPIYVPCGSLASYKAAMPAYEGRIREKDDCQ